GRLFFWAQMLRGDTADNIRGLDKYQGKNIGPIQTLELLEPYNDRPPESESEVASIVLDAYHHSDQNPLPEGYLLHMMRDWGDSFEDVLKELDLSKHLWGFIEECKAREWFNA